MQARFGIEEEGRFRPFRIRTLFLYNTALLLEDVYKLMHKYRATQVYFDSSNLYPFDLMGQLAQDFIVTVQIDSTRMRQFTKLENKQITIHWVYVVKDKYVDAIFESFENISIKVEGENTIKVFDSKQGEFTDKRTDYGDDLDDIFA